MADLDRGLPKGQFAQIGPGFGDISREIDAGEADIKKGALCVRDTGDLPNIKHGNDVVNFKFAGVALENGKAGNPISLATIGFFGPYTHQQGTLTDANIGDIVHMGDDDNEVQTAAGSAQNIVVGTIHTVESATSVIVKIGF